MNTALELKNVKKTFGTFSLEVEHLEVPSGYVTVLLGPNGAGKTTLLKVILGLVPLDEGSVFCLGENMGEHARRCKQRIGFVHEQDYLFEDLSPADMAGVMKRVYSSWDDHRFAELSERFAVERNKKIKNMSRGTRMKHAFALALSHHPDILILDEPMAGLDPMARLDMLKVVAEWMQGEGRTVILSSHITSDLDKVADHIVFLKNGRVIRSGDRPDILDRYLVCKGGLDRLGNGNRRFFEFIRETEFGFQGLTDRPEEVRRTLGDGLVFDRPNLEDMMVFTLGEEET